MQEAHVVRSNRRRRAKDDDTIEEWEQLANECDFEDDGWAKKVEETKPNVEIAGDIIEVRKLRDEVKELKALIEEVLKKGENHVDGKG
jgi:hypothetical protein